MDQASGEGASCLCAPCPLHPVRARSLASLDLFSRVCCMSSSKSKTDEKEMMDPTRVHVATAVYAGRSQGLGPRMRPFEGSSLCSQ